MSWGATAAVISITTALASAATAIISNEQASDAAEDAAFANKLRADAEARNREMEAAEAIKRQRERDKREKSAIRARLSQSGTLTTSGTPLIILGEVAANQDLAIQDAVRATNMEAASLRAQGTMGLWEAESTSAALTNKSIASGIQGVTAAASGYSDFKYNGAFTPVKGA
jgi:hypothetical protein